MKLLFLILFFLTIQTDLSVERGELLLKIVNSKSDKGTIQVLIFDKEKGYPDQGDQAIKKLSLPIKNKKAEILIEDLKPGTYAVSVFHDEDGDGKLRTNGVGIPKDRYGFSNNPSSIFGAPDFKKASFELKRDRKAVNIKLN